MNGKDVMLGMFEISVAAGATQRRCTGKDGFCKSAFYSFLGRHYTWPARVPL